MKGCEQLNKDPAQNTFMQDAEHENNTLKKQRDYHNHFKSTLFLFNLTNPIKSEDLLPCDQVSE